MAEPPNPKRQRKPKDRTRILGRYKKIKERLPILMQIHPEKIQRDIMDILAAEFYLSPKRKK
jgi:hypothetical protein